MLSNAQPLLDNAVPPRVRIYFMTYRRPLLLPRAMKSLCEQKFTDWVCELHNDDPEDNSCRELVERIGDPRIIICQHSTNYGAVKTFNECWNPIPNEFMSILEDDNWWEPDFLEKMVGIMDAHPEVDVAWTNMVRWRELPGNEWIRSDTVWDEQGAPLEFFFQSQPRQMMEALHSQGAMLVRARGPHMVQHPLTTPDFMVDAVKERYMRWPLVLHRRPLANFAVTLTTVRKDTFVEKVAAQALLVLDFLRKKDVSPSVLLRAWNYNWLTGRYARRAMIVGCLLSGRKWMLVRTVFGREFMMSALWFLRHPIWTVQIFKYVRSDILVSDFLRRADHAVLHHHTHVQPTRLA